MSGEKTMMNVSLDEVKRWHTKRGLDDLKDEEIVVNGIKKINEKTLEIEALANIYLKNGDFYTAHIKFIVKKERK